MSNARLTILQARAVKDKRITDSQFRTLAALGMYADEDGWCFPSLKTLGKDLSKSKQAVGRDTIALRKLGYLEVRAQFKDDGSRRSSLYRLRFDLPPRQTDGETPSAPSVDTPSTPEVDVNDPINDPINQASFEEITKAANRKVDAWLKLSQSPGIKKLARVDAILSYIAGALNINTETKRWKDFAKFVDDRQQSGQRLDVFIGWVKNQRSFDVQFWPPDKMREMWPQAFVNPTAPRLDGSALERLEAGG
jgi:hypothetical protein